MSQSTRSAILVWIVVCSVGCAGKSLDPISAETLIGRWRAVTKVDADEGNATRDAQTPTGETVAFRYDFNADHSYETSMELTGGLMPLMPQVAGKHAVRGTWSVVEVGRDTLTVELPNPKLAAAGYPAFRVKVVFQTKDRCVFDADRAEAMVLTRLP
jgi:hypothetical protein